MKGSTTGQEETSQSNIDSSKDTKEQEVIIYEFHFPADLCGRLIGRQGVHVDYIRQVTEVDLVVRDDPISYEKQVVALHGSFEIFVFFCRNEHDFYRSTNGYRTCDSNDR